MHYSDLVTVYEALEATSKRLEKTHVLSEFLQTVPENELEKVILLLRGRAFPPWDKRTLGFSSKLAVKAVAVASGESEKTVTESWKKEGDLGKVAVLLVGKKKQATLVSQDLTVREVFETLQKLPGMEGLGSTDRKTKTIAALLGHATGNGAMFLLRTVLETLRVGVADGTLRDAITWAYLQPQINYNMEKNDIEFADDSSREDYNKLTEAVQKAYDRCNDFSHVAVTAKEGGTAALGKIALELGTPIRVMLAQREATVEAGMARVGAPAALEYKYDGFRMQVHKDGSKVTIFTRRLENVTMQFPDVVDAVKAHVTAKTCLLDCEAVGYDAATGKYTAFQQISQRIRRKYDIDKLKKKLPIELNVFDILYLEGEELLDMPFSERRKKLEKTVKNVPKAIVCSSYIVTDSVAEGEKFYKAALAAGNEGVMCKALDGLYKPGSRVGHMVKVKPVLDTMDLVVVAAEWGEGKRSGWLTSFTVACKGDEGDFLTIGKVGTGLKELEQEDGVTFNQVTELLKPHLLSEDGRDVVVKPQIVFELAFEEIQASPSYESGYALRFPRVLRVRDDRDPEEITTLEEVRVAYEHQRGR
ncbi:ATP-dependent DNA ligase [Candidatus Woesearchaeota archaeon]|nr:ATP-dependent DNA ligase [Candidatus Woesearchaeota archaeon]